MTMRVHRGPPGTPSCRARPSSPPSNQRRTAQGIQAVAAPDLEQSALARLATGSTGIGERTSADLSSLMVELGRALKGVSFYGLDSPSTQSITDRAWRAWQADLGRAGPLELSVGDETVSADGGTDRVSIEHLTELTLAFERVGLEQLRISADFGSASFTALIAALSPSAHDSGDIYKVPGLEANGIAAPESLPCERPPEQHLERHLENPSELWPTRENEPAREPAELASGANTADPARCESVLREALRQLDLATTAEAHLSVAGQVTEAAAKLASGNSLDAMREAIYLLSAHASGANGRSARTTQVAAETLRGLAKSETLDELIFRACASDPTESVRAAQALLQIGKQAVPAMLDHIEADPDGPRAAAISALVVALGEAGVPSLREAIRSGNPTRARTAIRIAGDLQAPALIPALRDHLFRAAFAKEAAKALVEIGNIAAAEALLEGTGCENAGTARISVFCLGTLGAPSTLRPLVERLHAARQQGDWRLLREILSSIGQFQGCDPPTAERIKSFICQPRLGWRRPSVELRLDAITALGQLSGPSVERALQEVVSGRAPRQHARLRERARRILKRREQILQRAV